LQQAFPGGVLHHPGQAEVLATAMRSGHRLVFFCRGQSWCDPLLVNWVLSACDLNPAKIALSSRSRLPPWMNEAVRMGNGFKMLSRTEDDDRFAAQYAAVLVMLEQGHSIIFDFNFPDCVKANSGHDPEKRKR
jgi:hypothetical protein